MSKLERLHDWVHNNFWKYQAITKIPLVVVVIVAFLIIEQRTKTMPEFWIDLAYFIGTLACIGLPVYAILYFNDDNAEM